MDKSKKIITIVVIVVSILLILGISWYLLDTTGKINQGNYRLNDVLVTSSLEVKEQEIKGEDGQAKQALKLSEIPFELSQKNTIAILIPKDVEAKRIFLDQISLSSPSKKGTIELVMQEGKDNVQITQENKEVEVYPSEKENQYLVEFNVNNIGFAKDVKVPEETQAITYDGTILKQLNIGVEELQIEAKFNLNIIDTTGKKNVCQMKLKFPTEELLRSGISVVREEPTRFVFSIK